MQRRSAPWPPSSPAREYLAGEFSAADIMMIMVLRALRHSDLVARVPVLDAYRGRCEARPAFQRALAAQLAAFARHAPDKLMRIDMTHITVTTFKWVPPFAQGLVRDLRVRWALEEAGLPYREKLIESGEQNTPAIARCSPSARCPCSSRTA